MKNYGYNHSLELAHQSDKDWRFGAFSPTCLGSIPENERNTYLPQGEIQAGQEDMMDCATRAALNVLETKFTYLVQKKLLTQNNLNWLNENGYVQNGKVILSDRFVAINSGTTREGNSLKAPLEAIRKQGVIPKHLLPLEKTMTWDEYYDTSHITGEMIGLGQEFVKRFSLNYEQVLEIHYEELLNDDMLVVAGYAWPYPVNGEYPKSDLPPNHSFMVIRCPRYFIFDNYTDFSGDFIKKLAQDYDFVDYGYRVFITKEGTGKSINLFERLKSFLLSILWL